MYDTLETYYVPLEIWYTRTSVDKVRDVVKQIVKVIEPLASGAYLIETRLYTVSYCHDYTGRRILHSQDRFEQIALFRESEHHRKNLGAPPRGHGPRLCWRNQEKA